MIASFVMTASLGRPEAPECKKRQEIRVADVNSKEVARLTFVD